MRARQQERLETGLTSPIAIGRVGERAGVLLDLPPRRRQGAPGRQLKVVPVPDEGLELLRVEAGMDLAAAEPLVEVRDLHPIAAKWRAASARKSMPCHAGYQADQNAKQARS